MSTIESSPSGNGRGSDASLRSWIHLGIDRRSPGYCRVTFDHPPRNAVTAATVAELAELVVLIQEDADLNVVVFDSANPRFYLTHDGAESDPSVATGPPGPTGLRTWHDLLVRLSRAPVVSIASIRGRVRGAGLEFLLACDLRFASLESTLLGRCEAGAGAAPEASMARLPRSAGGARALEILLVAEDQLDDEVDRIAARLAQCDHEAIARARSSAG